MLTSPILSGSAASGGGTWTLTLSSNEDNVDIKTKLEALWGSMTSAVDAVVTVASGVYIGSTDFNNPAMVSGTSWPSGSTLKVVNNGYIRGAGGAGANDGVSGYAGGTALRTYLSIVIDNTYGYIFGGGGGGGHGGLITAHSGVVGGGGGGGGQGDDGGSGGQRSTGVAFEGTDGGAGDTGGGGHGGSGGVGGGGGGYVGGQGGDGGGWGTAGLGGGSATVGGVPGGGGATSGGVAGRAVQRGLGMSITFLGGNNSTQVKGTVGF